MAGVLPGQSPEVLQAAGALAKTLAARLICAYVDEASYLVEWDPARSAHRLSLHPETDNAEIRAVTAGAAEQHRLGLRSPWHRLDPAVTGWRPGPGAGQAGRRGRCRDDHRGHTRAWPGPPHFRCPQRFGGGVAQPPPGPSDPDRSGPRASPPPDKTWFLTGQPAGGTVPPRLTGPPSLPATGAIAQSSKRPWQPPRPKHCAAAVRAPAGATRNSCTTWCSATSWCWPCFRWCGSSGGCRYRSTAVSRGSSMPERRRSTSSTTGGPEEGPGYSTDGGWRPSCAG